MLPRSLLAAASAALLLVLAAPTPATAAEDPRFLSDIDDLPLMEGLAEVPDAGSTFDTPAGRIVEAYGEGRALTRDQITTFYAATLPQLGWTAAGDASFRREGERLRIEILGDRPPLTVRFLVAPE
ncbi:MAG: hypothetical protein H7840_00110 [Alphaproteobacteria bacterium]